MPNKLLSRFDAPAGSNSAEDSKSVAHRTKQYDPTKHKECSDHHNSSYDDRRILYDARSDQNPGTPFRRARISYGRCVLGGV